MYYVRHNVLTLERRVVYRYGKFCINKSQTIVKLTAVGKVGDQTLFKYSHWENCNFKI